PDVMQLLLERKAASILRVSAVDHVAQRRYAPFGLVLEPDRPYAFAINGGYLFARAQIFDGAGTLGCAHTISDAATGPALIEAEQETGPLGRPAVHEGKNTERARRADEPRLDPLDERKVRPPHQRTISKYPELFGRVQEIRIHGCDIKQSGVARKSEPCGGTMKPVITA